MTRSKRERENSAKAIAQARHADDYYESALVESLAKLVKDQTPAEALAIEVAAHYSSPDHPLEEDENRPQDGLGSIRRRRPIPSEVDSFPTGVATKLKTYVYRLIDPRNGETFYVGKGQGDRVFSHIRAQVEGDEIDNKLKRIREISLAGFEVAHVIHRHGMDDKTAFEVEAALIDAYPGLTNIVSGAGSTDYGAMHAKEIITRYCAEPAVFHHRALLINVNRSATEIPLYQATRFAWKISKTKAEQADVVLATRHGMIVDAFVAHRWLEATAANFPAREDQPGRLGFVGEDAPADIKRLYVGKRVPDEYRKRGAANPIKYTWDEQSQ